MSHVNIEFGHIYADQNIGYEQDESIELLHNFCDELTQKGDSYSSVMLIDELHVNSLGKMLDVEEYISYIKQYSCVDYVAFESQLSSFFDQFISKLDDSQLVYDFDDVGSVTVHYKKIRLMKQNMPSCTVLVAIWNLCRLGVYALPLQTMKLSEKSFVADKVISILPRKYKSTEKKALTLLLDAGYIQEAANIEHIYF